MSDTRAVPQVDCRYFNGYKPCGRSEQCTASCEKKEIVTTHLLLIHLGALGAVVRSTALLPAIRRRYPHSHITWVTDRPADRLLAGHPLVDRVVVGDHDGVLELRAMSFDVALVVDKSLRASGILASTSADLVLGFKAESNGAIVPANPEARELWEIGLSDHVKFHLNRKTETQLIHEALDLGPWQRDPYSLHLTPEEHGQVSLRRKEWGKGHRAIIGINTGCAATLPAKKLSVAGHVELISRLLVESNGISIVLLGGREDAARNFEITCGVFKRTGKAVIESPTEGGLRDGLVSVAACDVVISGDSLGMHMAIAMGLPVVAWFGPSCAHEIDLYDRGVAIQTKATCSPCWKRHCPKQAAKETMCYDQIDWTEMVNAVYALLSDSHSANRLPGRYTSIDPSGSSASR